MGKTTKHRLCDMWKIAIALTSVLIGCRAKENGAPADERQIFHRVSGGDPDIQSRILLSDLLKARRLSPEFDEPTRLQLDWVCRTTKSGDLRLATFMAAWPLDPIFPTMPFLKIWGAGCGTYESDDFHFRHTVLPVRILFNLSKDVSQ